MANHPSIVAVRTRRPNQSILRKSTLNTHWKDWGWSWSYNILVTWCEEAIQWKRPWCWGKLGAEGEEGVRKWDDWMTSLMQRHELGQALADGEGQEGLACCSPWGRIEPDTTRELSNSNGFYWTCQRFPRLYSQYLLNLFLGNLENPF